MLFPLPLNLSPLKNEKPKVWDFHPVKLRRKEKERTILPFSVQKNKSEENESQEKTNLVSVKTQKIKRRRKSQNKKKK